jgi:biotin synthase
LNFSELLERAVEAARLAPDEVVRLLQADEKEYIQLAAAADRVRRQNVGDAIHLRGLVEFSNICHRQCLYCGLRASNQALARYRMTLEEILVCVEQVVAAGLGTVVLQSGEDSWWTAERLGELIRRIRRQHPDLAITLSIGERPRAEYAAFREAGADRFLLRFETSNPELYQTLQPDSSLQERLQCLHWLRELGYEVGSGFLIGLPGQTLPDLAADLLLLQRLEVDMAGIGPFIPNPQTPLATAAGGSVGLTLRSLAVLRLLCPPINIPVTTALATMDPRGREKGWQAGANVVMPNATPAPYMQQYLLYPNKGDSSDALAHSLRGLLQSIIGSGRAVGQGPGRSPRWEARSNAPHTQQ